MAERARARESRKLAEDYVLDWKITSSEDWKYKREDQLEEMKRLTGELILERRREEERIAFLGTYAIVAALCGWFYILIQTGDQVQVVPILFFMAALGIRRYYVDVKIEERQNANAAHLVAHNELERRKAEQ